MAPVGLLHVGLLMPGPAPVHPGWRLRLEFAGSQMPLGQLSWSLEITRLICNSRDAELGT